MATGIDTGFSMSYWDIEAHASALRRALGLGQDDWIEPAGLFARLDTLTVFGDPVFYVIKDHLEAEGKAQYDENRGRYEIVMPSETYEGVLDGNPRDMFTFGHELGHVVLHARVLRSRELHAERRALMRSGRRHPAYMDSEWQANAFAGALLAPAPRMNRELSGERVQLQLSQQAANVRRDTTRKRVHQLVQAASHGWRNPRDWERAESFAAMVPPKETPSFQALGRKTAF